MNGSSKVPLAVDQVCWESWSFTERAVLCLIIKDGKVLLIHKKKGLGKGKINAPGGRIEPGEKPLQSAVRETEEEVTVTPLHPVERGELHFVFTNGFSLHCTVFTADDFRGTPSETDEALPVWFDLAAIPYGQMWEDDRLWLPMILGGKNVRGFFIFDEDKMIDSRLQDHIWSKEE